MVLLKNLKMTPVWAMECLDKLNNLAGVSSPTIEQSLGHLLRWTFHPENPIISIVKKSLLNLLPLPLLKPIPPPPPPTIPKTLSYLYAKIFNKVRKQLPANISCFCFGTKCCYGRH